MIYRMKKEGLQLLHLPALTGKEKTTDVNVKNTVPDRGKARGFIFPAPETIALIRLNPIQKADILTSTGTTMYLKNRPRKTALNIVQAVS